MLTTLSFETFRLHTNIVLSINFSPDGQKITSSSQDSTIHNWGTLCRPGYYGAHLECQPCAPRSQSKADMDSCLPCTAGTYSVADVSECDTYSTGTFEPQKGQANCDTCPTGGYCANNATADTFDGGFTACPIGTFSTVAGESTGSSCIQCPPGKPVDCLSVATTNTIYLYIHSQTPFHFLLCRHIL